MEIEQILEQVDRFFANNQGEQARQLLVDSIEKAKVEKDDNSLLQLLNELLGYYRETSCVSESFHIASEAIKQAKAMGLEGTLPYATTLLNIANAYRAGGRLAESLQCYLEVREIYQVLLSAENLLVASLENNLSLLYQEMGDYVCAKESLLRALAIVEQKGEAFEIAVTHANLANTCIQLQELGAALEYGNKAVKEFEEMGVKDAHYAAGLAALATYYYQTKQYAEASEYFQKAMDIMEENLGKNEYYYRLEEYLKACTNAHSEENYEKQMHSDKASGDVKGMSLCKEFYENYGKPMLHEKFPEYRDKIAVGLVGKGSDCFGYDDAYSRDHDWGAGFVVWLDDETYDEIGEAMQAEYEKLPTSFHGRDASFRPSERKRRGVMRISDFYKGLLGTSVYEEINWTEIEDFSLAEAVNGEVFQDQLGEFSSLRERLQKGYPENILYKKIAQAAASFAQCGQYNYARMLKRGDTFTAQLMMADACKYAMKLCHYIEGKYPPHDKWLRRSTEELSNGKLIITLLDKAMKASSQEETLSAIEEVARYFAQRMYEKGYISDVESHLAAHTQEFLMKADFAIKSNEELVEEIARIEFEAFDKVRNVGGRASCQNDWYTFSIMRKSQYLTWNREMLMQYLYDFNREYNLGHNLIEEKYGRMMQSTAPKEYEQIKDYFPRLSPEKQAIIEQIVALQVGWMEAFEQQYPKLAGNARSIHTTEDNLFNTSYETYLRGELGTYSDKMLELYGRYVVECARRDGNLAYEIMQNSVLLYGYEDMESAEARMW